MTVDVTASSSPIAVTAAGTTVDVTVPAAGTVSVDVGNGPAGATGPQGQAGPQGPAGPAGPSGGISDAPSNGTVYGRKNQAWAQVLGAEIASSTPLVTPIQLTSATYSTPVSVSLAGTNSLWHVFGTLSFDAVDYVDADVQVNLSGSGGTIIKGSAWIKAPAGSSYENYASGAISIAVPEGQSAKVDIDYIVSLPSSTLAFGFPVRRTAGTAAAYIVDTETGYSRLYARRLA